MLVPPGPVTIVASSIAAATVLETATPHHLVSGDTVAIAGHLGSTPAVDGSRVVTVIDATHVSIPLAVTIAGAGGTLTRTLAVALLTIEEGKQVAGLDWAPGDARDALIGRFIQAATRKLQTATGIVPLTTAYDLLFDALPTGKPIDLPWRPVQTVTVGSIDTAGVTHELAPADVILDRGDVAPRSARVSIVPGAWPTDMREFQPWILHLVVGYASVALLNAADPMLVHLVARLVAHYATLGRDLASIDPATDIPMGWSDDIAAYVPVVVP
jgi:uncharacterized phiE125 gp8 family phage protein